MVRSHAHAQGCGVTPLLSLVIPTCNRRASLHRLLQALAADATAPPFDVVVVDDGSRDDTLAFLQDTRFPFPVRVLSQQSCGPARARNAGAAAATGRVLVFFDDDVEPVPGTLARHAAFHAERLDLIGVGDLPPVVLNTSFIGVTLRGWWERMLHDFRKPGHRFGFRNVLTGHLSVARVSFEALGGFDPELRAHEDWEFGLRAMKADMQVGFVAGAVAHHHETSDLRKILKRKFDEGVADVELSRKHPQLTTALPFYWPPRGRRSRALVRLAWSPAAGDAAARYLMAKMQFAESLRMRGRWRHALDLLLLHWYWRGVASVLPDLSALRSVPFTINEPLAPEIFVDLADGIPAAEQRFDRMRPSSAALFFCDVPVGVIHAVAGLERLRGEHLRAVLAAPYYRRNLRLAMQKVRALPAVLCPDDEQSADSRGGMTHVGAPLVRDVELSARLATDSNAQQRAAIPPVHHMA
jgi:GT2 family glycosyltransferase